jgi:RNA polymerase sigma-70 factor (ECF subfamily)
MLVKRRDVADDIFQETFIKVMHSLREGHYEDSGKFTPWVVRIAYNITIDYFRSQRQNNIISGDVSDWATISSPEFADLNVEEKSMSIEIRKDVRSLIDKLPEEQREIVVMRNYLGMSFKDIAEKFGVNMNTALGRMRYAVLNMRKLAEEYDMVLEM